MDNAIKEQLNSIGLGDIDKLKDKTLNEEEIKSRSLEAEKFWRLYFKDVLQLLTQAQLEYIAENANSIEALQFGRGTINGFYLINEWFLKQINIAREHLQEQENEISE